MKCKMCGHEWDEKLCGRCKKGTVKRKKTLWFANRNDYEDDELWVCTWCGHEEYICTKTQNLPVFANGYQCPECMYMNKAPQECFITTACTSTKGLADDCYELTKIREFRDTVLKKDPKLKEIVDEYYINAPKVVSAINLEANKEGVYEDIYTNMILPCLEAIEKEDETKAVEIYYTHYVKLCKKYIS